MDMHSFVGAVVGVPRDRPVWGGGKRFTNGVYLATNASALLLAEATSGP